MRRGQKPRVMTQEAFTNSGMEIRVTSFELSDRGVEADESIEARIEAKFPPEFGAEEVVASNQNVIGE